MHLGWAFAPVAKHIKEGNADPVQAAELFDCECAADCRERSKNGGELVRLTLGALAPAILDNGAEIGPNNGQPDDQSDQQAG
jgi:hypothetical protein